MVRICREAGATVRFNTRLREMNVAVSANDERSIEVLASGLLLHHQAASTRAREDKERKSADWWSSHWRRGERWSTEAKEFVDSLAAARAREAPHILWRSAFLGWRRRWSRMLAVSCARAFAAMLVALPATALPRD